MNQHHASALLSQSRLLTHFVRSTHDVKTSSSSLNYVEFQNKVGSSKNLQFRKRVGEERVLILTHGFGLGLGYFFDNYDHLLQHFDRIIAVDWLGMGCSARTAKEVSRFSIISNLFSWGSKEKNEEIRIKTSQRVSDELIDTLEELRQEKGINNFVLAGHSLGGYLATEYALKYPNKIESLVLISPAGISNRPSEDSLVPDHVINWRVRMIQKLWKLTLTPQTIIRFLGKNWGQDLVRRAVYGRFTRKWSPLELELLSQYLYHISAAPGNGEFALNAILEPLIYKSSISTRPYQVGIFAINPLETKIRQHLKIPLLMLYGDDDWLRYPSLEHDIQQWKEIHGMNVSLKIISNAGHHLYLDNPKEFNETIIHWLQDVEKKMCVL